LDTLNESNLIKKGAEASIYLSYWYGKEVIIKSRKTKKYRHSILDQKIRRFRTIHEPQFINEAKKAGVSTPLIFQVDTKNMIIIMELIRGKQIKYILQNQSREERADLCRRIGELVAKLHSHNIIHGDLTTSNFILSNENRLVLVDFGLAERQIEIETKGVDLHLMKRGLQSTHNQIAQECFRNVLIGYSEYIGQSFTKVILKKIGEIERRGRYIAERKNKK
jgi:TP53 regulating kinase-like protein